MPSRIPEKALLRRKVFISLNDDNCFVLLEETRKPSLAPSIMAHPASAEGLPEITMEGRALCRQINGFGYKGTVKRAEVV